MKIEDVFAASMKNLNLARGHYYKDVLAPIDFLPSQSKCLKELYALGLKVDSFRKMVSLQLEGKHSNL